MKVLSIILFIVTVQNALASGRFPMFSGDKIINGQSFSPSGFQEIINGHNIPDLGQFREQHPGSFNTVALVKEDGKIFCTGSLIAENLVATAKHCLMDKKGQKIRLYFGDDTTKPDLTLYRPIVDYQVRYPIDWTMTFPSFDVAWVKFSGNLPEPFRPLPILANPGDLEINSKITQVGYGDHDPAMGSIKAGIKLWGTTQLNRYVNNARFFHILLFQGEEGQGSCHGDSGGPAYAKINGQWFITGVTNGFDVVLTPMTMTRTGDPQFPYNVRCSQNQSLYSFLGAHGDWIEETSGIEVFKSEEFMKLDRQDTLKDLELQEWCTLQDIGSPSWNLLKILLDQEIDRLPQSEGSLFYENCDRVVDYLSSLEEVDLDHNKVMSAKLAFGRLKLLPNLKKVALYNFPKENVDLKTIAGLSLEQLILKNVGIENLDFLSPNSIKKLSLEQNPLNSLKGIIKLVDLEEITVSGTPLKDLSPLRVFNLKGLNAVGLNATVVFGLDKVSGNLERLDLRNTIIPDPGVISTMLTLKELWLTGDIGAVDLTNLKELTYLSLKDFKEGKLIFPQSMQNLKELSASQSDIGDLEFLSSATMIEKINLTFNRIRSLEPLGKSTFPYLVNLNLSANPILNAEPLANLESLEILRLFRTPLQQGLIPKSEENCPTLKGPQILRKFCSK